MKFWERPTIDIVVVLLTVVVGSTVILCTIGILIVRMFLPSVDVGKGAETVGNILTTVVGALVGLIGGRAQGRLEANGKT